MLADYQRRMVPIIQRHGGAIDKFLGDGIMATFGATRPCRLRRRRVGAALELAAMGRRWENGIAPLPISIAVASGELVVGAVGDADRLEFTVIGNPVNLAAKLEKHTRIEDVSALTTAATLRTARQQGFPGRFPAPARRHVAGVAQPLELVVLAA